MGKGAVKGASQLGWVAWKSRTQANGKPTWQSKTGRMRFVNSRFWGVYEVGERNMLKFGPQKNAKMVSFPRIEPRLFKQ